MSGTRVLVADPLRIFRWGVRGLLARQGGFEVVEAGTLAEVVRTAIASPVDIALVDLALPPRGGIEAAERLAECSRACVVLWGFDPSAEVVFEAIRRGAHGFLHKEISSADLVRALRGAMQGQAPLARDLAALMIDALHAYEAGERARRRALVLSPREREVLALVADGAGNERIAAALAISEFTVKRHVQNIREKLRLSSRQALADFHRGAFGAGANPVPTREVA